VHNLVCKHALTLTLAVLIAAGLPPDTTIGKWQLVPMFVAWIMFDVGHNMRITDQKGAGSYLQVIATGLAVFAVYVGLFVPPVA
tara:strand:+ start:400 stop:651 length:252 start_codon:yes stop_codon:yes gene_type:complete